MSRKSTAFAASIVTGALVASAFGGTKPANAYNTGVKSLHLAATSDGCSDQQALPCTPGAGRGHSNELRVSQTKRFGRYHFTTVEGTSTIDDTAWLSAEIGAECRFGHHLVEMSIDGRVHDGEADGLHSAFNYGETSGPFAFPLSLGVDGKKAAVREVALNIPLNKLFNGGLLSAGYNKDMLLAAGEAEIHRRLDAGMSAAEARGTAYEKTIYATVYGQVHCRYNGVIQAEYIKRRALQIPIKVKYLPVEIEPAVGGQAHGEDVIAESRVTDVELTVLSDPDDACTLHLSATIQTNGPTKVQYRFKDPHGQPSNTYSVHIDQTQTAFIDRTVSVPWAPMSDPTGDFATEEGSPDIGEEAAAAGDPNRYVGTYLIEIISPNHDLASGEFDVPFCFSVLGGTATFEPIGQQRAILGLMLRY